ncbi:MAG: hypothetical protein IH944_00500 [Armatimonadetes bacterium]|nr:hypothetical protein [Armatimonadota bacterium]
MIRKNFEIVANAKRFSMPALYRTVWPLLEGHKQLKEPLAAAKDVLKDSYRNFGQALLRHVFLIEVVKTPKIETTKTRVRWFKQLNDDPRYCSFDECLSIAIDLTNDLNQNLINDKIELSKLNLFFSGGILPYEAPLDYIIRPLDAARIHRPGNIAWTCTDKMLRTMKLRIFLQDPDTSPAASFFTSVLEDKVMIKTYLTDRVLTGDHKTNREKRWEVHPQSVHFALRRDCMDIEYSLIEQLCRFEDFPEEYRKPLQQQGILPEEHVTFKCPITLEKMSFAKFRSELENPMHGKSAFQVGHLNPLKLDNSASVASGHTAKNISWMSADGNRIQGSLSLDDTRLMLKRIASNYKAEK